MSKQVKIGNITIGGGNKIAIQSMTNVSVLDIESTAQQFKELQLAGCDIVRVAIPDLQSAKAIPTLKTLTDMPIVADTHFNSQITLKSIENGADKVRINPGNMKLSEMKLISDCAKMHKIPIRIGLNEGSANKSYLEKHNGDKDKALLDNIGEFVNNFSSFGFDDLVLSIKSTSVKKTIQLNRQLAKTFDFPLHIGVTEAGLYTQGLIKNSIGIGSLLCDGIGDTIRVSLTAHPKLEVEASKQILSAVGKAEGVTFVSCPKCGRCKIDLEALANAVFEQVKDIKINLKIAVMGCEVNGPGECMDADLGLAGGNGKIALFKKGEVFKIVDQSKAIEEFTKELKNLC